MKLRYAALVVAIPMWLSQFSAFALGTDEQFLAARDALRSGDKARLERLAPTLQGYELEAYVDYCNTITSM